MKKVLVTLAIFAVMICGCGKVEEVKPETKDAPAVEKKEAPKVEEKKEEPAKVVGPKVEEKKAEEPKAEK